MTAETHPARDRRAERHAATRAEILDAAWSQVRERGLAGLSLRDLAAEVGMRAPSLYSYFPNKNAIYDAMYEQGNREFLQVLRAVPRTDDAGRDLLVGARAYVEFCVADVARAQLLFQRPIPGFEPSPESYEVAVEALSLSRAALRRVGTGRRRDLDLWTALVSGLVFQQISNEPDGTRWARLVDDVHAMFLRHVEEARS